MTKTLFSVKPHVIVDAFLYVIIVLTWILVIYTGRHLAQQELHLVASCVEGSSTGILGGMAAKLKSFVKICDYS